MLFCCQIGLFYSLFYYKGLCFRIKHLGTLGRLNCMIIGEGSVLTDLTDHDRKSKNSNKVVDELEADLKDGGGIWQTPDGDQCLHSEVITTDVAVGKTQTTN